MNPQEPVAGSHLDYSKILPETRRKAGFTLTLSFGARLFYGLLVDYSVWVGVNMRRGVLRKTNSYWARNFGVCERTIQNWKEELRDSGLVWMSEKFMKNSMPETVYHIVVLTGPVPVTENAETADGSLVEEEDYPASNRRRSRMLRDPATGCWARKGGVETAESPKSPFLAQTPDVVDRECKNLPSPAEAGCRSERQPVSVGSGKPLPLPTATGFRGERKIPAVADGKQIPLPAATGFRGERKISAEIGETQKGDSEIKRGGGAAPLPEIDLEAAFRKWERTLDGMFETKLAKLLGTLMEECRVAPTEASREFVTRKLRAVRSRLNPKHPDQAKAAGKPPAPPKKAVPGPGQVPTQSDAAAALFAKARKEAGV